ncbi:MAG: hypothetical protein H0X34_17765 [Chthoniobacterales bacterium]|nr:hypothetical protein [Chthoniobacterales bacterium]
MRKASAKLLLLLIFGFSTALAADGLSDVRATLQNLATDRPLSARVEIKTHRSGGESDKQKQSEGVSAVIVHTGAEGLDLSWTPEQIKQSREAAWEKTAHPDASKSSLATLTALEADEALDLLDAADPLRRWLEKAVVLEDKPDHYQGKPARRLLIRLDLKLPEEGRKAMKSSAALLQLWLGADGVPVAADRDIRIRFSKFFLSYRVHEHETREYQNAGGRLIVVRASHDSYGSGLGHSEESHSTTTVTPLSD